MSGHKKKLNKGSIFKKTYRPVRSFKLWLGWCKHCFTFLRVFALKSKNLSKKQEWALQKPEYMDTDCDRSIAASSHNKTPWQFQLPQPMDTEESNSATKINTARFRVFKKKKNV